MIASAVKLSLLVAIGSTIIVGVLGTWIAWVLTRRSFPGQRLVEALLFLPLVLPPTVSGYYLLVLLGRQGWVGRPLFEGLGITIPFTPVACVIAASVMALPLMIAAARGAFESLDPRFEWVAGSLGHSPRAVFWRVALPAARNGLTVGLLLSFARAAGEFGATLMLAGNVAGRTQTLPLAIYEAVMAGDDRLAAILATTLTAVSIVVIVLTKRLGFFRTTARGSH